MVVTAPQRAPMGRIRRTLAKNEEWVRRQVDKLREAPLPLPPPRWVDGELHPFLGRAYPLRLLDGDAPTVWRTDEEIQVYLPSPHRNRTVQKVVDAWYREEARAFFLTRMKALVRATPALGVRRMPELKLRRMKARWGSCSPDGRILMNTHAIKLPPRLVDYILMHELCHLRVPNHSADFWAHLGRCMPDWERRKTALDRRNL